MFVNVLASPCRIASEYITPRSSEISVGSMQIYVTKQLLNPIDAPAGTPWGAAKIFGHTYTSTHAWSPGLLVSLQSRAELPAHSYEPMLGKVCMQCDSYHKSVITYITSELQLH